MFNYPSSSSFHRRPSTTKPPPNHHHHTAGEDNPPMMDLFSGPSEEDKSTTNTTKVALVEKEHMFDKVVTPSDVGKLNRLVIPKQHAEKYFPLDSSSTNEKGLFLNFEDINGKPWRFRYSYWNSSQSYVMTKGWSRFVKEKKLDAGDIVSFQRGLGDSGKDRLFIDWRHRPDAPHHHQIHPSFPLLHHRSLIPWTSVGSYYGNTSTSPYGYSGAAIVNGNPCPPGSIVYLRSGEVGSEYGLDYGPRQYPGVSHLQRRSGFSNNGGGNSGSDSHEKQQQRVFDSVPVVQGRAAAAAKRVRLFGVDINSTVLLSNSTASLIAHHRAPMLQHTYGGFDYYRSSSSSSVPSLQMRPCNDDDDDDDVVVGVKGKGASSMSLDLEI